MKEKRAFTLIELLVVIAMIALLMDLVDRMEALAGEPDRKDLCWQLAIDDDVLSDSIRQCEFVNWINKLVLSKAGQSLRLKSSGFFRPIVANC